MSNRIPLSKEGESSLEYSNRGLLQFPPQPMVYPGQPPHVGDISNQLQMPPQVVQAPGPSQASGSNTKRVPIPKPCDFIDALRDFLPYPRKENAAATLSDVIDYIKITEEEIKQLEEIRSQQLSQLAARSQYQATAAAQGNIIPLPGSPVDGLIEIPNQMGGTNHAAQGNNIPLPGSPIDGLVEMPNQMGGTNHAAQGNNIPLPGSPIEGLLEMPDQMVGTNDVVPATSFPVNKADVAAAAAVNQAADAGAVNQVADAAAVNQPPDAAAVVNYQPWVFNEDPALLATMERICAFGELMDRLSYP